MIFKKIMVPYDGSDHAKRAIECAKGLMGDAPDTTLIIVHAIPSGVVGVNELGTTGSIDSVPLGMADSARESGALQPALDEASKKVIANLGDMLDGLEGRVAVRATAGSSAASSLVSFAEENNCDLIVMGRRGLGAIRSMLGSVSLGILHATDIPVLTVK